MGQLIGHFGAHDYFAVKNAGFFKNGLYRFFDGKNEKGRRALIVLGIEDDIVFARTIKKSEDVMNPTSKEGGLV